MIIAILGGFWPWQGTGDRDRGREVAYSTAYAWIDQSKVAKVVLVDGSLEGTLRAPQPVDGKAVTKFHAAVPDNDDKLVPLLRERQVEIKVEREARSMALQIVIALLPWVLIIEFQEEHAFLGHRIATDAGTSDATISSIEREARALLGRELARATRRSIPTAPRWNGCATSCSSARRSSAPT